MTEYLRQVWRSRYFWIHLATSDLRSKWRRSFLGALWSIVQPLGLTILLAVVLGKLFKTDIARYAPYILSGIIVWDCVVTTAIGGSMAFVQADAYIKQTRHPLAIYTLRTTLASLAVLAMASLGLIAWTLVVLPENFGLCWISALAIFPLLGLICWPMATCLAFIGTPFRDLPHALGLILQALWFVSPIYFDAQLLRDNGLRALVDYNPIYHVLQFVRAPLLQGQWPSTENLAWCLTTFAVTAAFAWLIGRKVEDKIIFYL
ncbi:ABC transporter permease [Bradyrhizobium diazoefficiens]|nr:ABC transporter permease [Bradyrhizobium diazoefficiens]MBR0850302.1 ABC transporter permease [Bradyrhizobium diazoefficiens]